jgi:coenzyme F420-dependent glucose-6-phosphate dehydrogenase
MRWGYTCSSEEFEAGDLVRHAVEAEGHGFEFVTVSDHFHPWTQSQGHSPFAWSTVAGIAVRTDRVAIGTGVTCPLIRMHPAIVAHAAATSAELSDGRFFLGVGTGEALNEHVTGARWPPVDVRQDMLVEALDVIRRLWRGDTVDHHGPHYTVENARLFSAPPVAPSVVWAAGGPASARLAARHADGLWATSPSTEVVDAYREAGGHGEVIGQLTVCWHPDPAEAKATAHRIWPNAALAGQLSQELPTFTTFEQAATMVSEDDVAASVVCGADVGAVVDAVGRYVDAGFTSVHFHQVGPDQTGFLRWWREELAAAVSDRATSGTPSR